MKHPYNRALRRESKAHYDQKDWCKRFNWWARRHDYVGWGYFNECVRRDYKAGLRRTGKKKL